jgi:hypothetical protein
MSIRPFLEDGRLFDRLALNHDTMNTSNFTIKAQEALQQAFNIAASKGQQGVEC